MQEKLEHRKLKKLIITSGLSRQGKGARSAYGLEGWELTPKPSWWEGLSHYRWPRKPLCQAPTLENTLEEKETFRCCHVVKV